MELKPGYKRTEVGLLPAHWDVCQLGTLATKVGSGITPTGGEKVYKKEGRPFLRSQNVGWGQLLLDDIAYIDEETHSRFSDTEIKLYDVLLNITGASIGRSAVADDRLIGGNVNQHVCVIRTDGNRLEARYLNLFLLSEGGQRQIDSFQAGGNRQGLNFGQIRSFQIPLPPLLEQRAIAEALSDADELIESLEQLITKKRAIKQGVMQELLTGRRRLPGFEGEWEMRRFGDIVQLKTDRVDPRRSGVLSFCVELENIEQGTGRLISYTATEEGASLKSVFQQGDVLFGKLRAYLRKFWLANRNGVCSTEIWVLAAIQERVIPSFLFQLVMMDRFIEAASMAYGTHMPRSDWRVVEHYGVRLPLIEEQTAIAIVLSDMDAEIAALEQRRDKTQLLKQGMMQELLTGKTRLI